MSSLQRQLVNLDILNTDMDMLSVNEQFSATHRKLLNETRSVLKNIATLAENETDMSYRRAIENSGISLKLESRRLPTIFIKLIDCIIEHKEAFDKADQLALCAFDHKTDSRLELLHAKAIKAKAQLKTVASALGKDDYTCFLRSIGLANSEWRWQVLFDR